MARAASQAVIGETNKVSSACASAIANSACSILAIWQGGSQVDRNRLVVLEAAWEPNTNSMAGVCRCWVSAPLPSRESAHAGCFATGLPSGYGGMGGGWLRFGPAYSKVKKG